MKNKIDGQNTDKMDIDCPVKIVVRERPVLCKDNEDDEEIVVSHNSTDNNLLFVNNRPFIFDSVLPVNTSQEDLYKELMKPLVEKFFKGYNCTILAYGQTGTGKTYTMGFEFDGIETSNMGIVPRILKEIFNENEDIHREQPKNEIFASFTEIYNEKVYDILSDNPTEQINVKGCKFAGSTKKVIQNIDEAYQLLKKGNKNRHVRPTKMNSQSSRSHAIFTLYISVKSDLENKSVLTCFNLVDLAGSEGVRRTGHQGVALTEGVHINQGLLSIGKVLQALSSGEKVIPYRDSVLSSVLQESLNLNSYLVLMACISPERKDISETLSTLRFAQNAKSLRCLPQMNTLLLELKKNMTSKSSLRTSMQNQLYSCKNRKTPKKLTLSNVNSINFGSAVKKSNTICTPSKVKRLENIRWSNNKPDIGLTSNGKLGKFQDNKNENIYFPMSLNENYNGEALNICAGRESTTSSRYSTISFNTSMSTAVNEQPPSSFSPIVRRCLTEFESTLDGKMQKMFDNFKNLASENNQEKETIQKPQPTHQPSAMNNSSSNRLSWGSIKSELQKIVRSELTSLTQSRIETSETVHNEILEKPDQHQMMSIQSTPFISSSKIHSENREEHISRIEADSSSCFIHDGNETILTVKSSRKRTCTNNNFNLTNNTTIMPRRKSKRFSSICMNFEPSNGTINETTVLRRSLRLSIKADAKRIEKRNSILNNSNNNSKENINFKKPKAPRRKQQRKSETSKNNNKVSEFFKKLGENNSMSETPTKKGKQLKKDYEKTILDLLNNGSIKELQILPQVGLKTAYQIIAYRTMNSKFKNLEDVGKVPWRGKGWERFKKANNLI